MRTTYRLNINELDNGFIDSLKAIFRNKEIEITVHDLDETDYLMRSGANRKRLLDAVENVGIGKNLIEAVVE
ncbi:MAG: hypothetical protein HZA20_11850 [Nitrospirae bacterium]|nr:hypothetical protein [Nitrospirota bacterium]